MPGVSIGDRRRFTSRAPDDGNGKTAARDRGFAVTEDDIEYFERRRRECIERATAAPNPEMVGIYRSFAVHYMRALQHHAVVRDNEAAA